MFIISGCCNYRDLDRERSRADSLQIVCDIRRDLLTYMTASYLDTRDILKWLQNQSDTARNKEFTDINLLIKNYRHGR